MSNLRTLDLTATADTAEVWQMTGTREYVIGEPPPEDGEAEYIGSVAGVRQQQQDLTDAN